MIYQFTSSLLIIETTQVILMTIATFMLLFAISKRHEFYLLLCSYISLTIGLIFSVVKLITFSNSSISLLFYLFATIFLFITIFHKYYELFLSKADLKYYVYISIIFIAIMALMIIGIEYVILGILIFGIELSLYIYFKKETPTYGLFSFAMIIGFISIVTIILEGLGYPWAYELRQGMAIVLASIFLSISIVAILEYRMESTNIQYRKVYDRAELYKDLFLHDVNNILQSLLNAGEFCTIRLSEWGTKEKRDELLGLFKIIQNQVNRGSNLISNIRILSDLDLKKLPVKEVELGGQILQAIQKVEEIYVHKQSEINFHLEEDELYVKANNYLSELFYNLLMNSFRYNESPIVKIDINASIIVKKKIRYVKVKILDNGTGISEQLKSSLNRERLDIINSKRRLGLGLIFVYKLINYFEGQMSISARPEGAKKGTKVTLYLQEV